MKTTNALAALFGAGVIAIAVSVAAHGQAGAPLVQANPTPGCKSDAKQIKINRKNAMEFFKQGVTGEERVALADPSYEQHNPQFVKNGKADGISDYEEYKKAFTAAGRGGRGGGGGRGPAAGPTPPPGNPFEVVTAECDIVTLIHMNYRQDPNEAPGTFYQVYTFDTYRFNKDGKFTEHWDGAVINPNPPAAGPAAGPPGR